MEERSLRAVARRAYYTRPWDFGWLLLTCVAQTSLSISRLASGVDEAWELWLYAAMIVLLAPLGAASLVGFVGGLRLRRRRLRAYRRATPGNVHRDDLSRRARRTVEEHGIHLRYVPGDISNPAYIYTVGLSARHHPELVVTGPDIRAAGDEISDAVDRVARGKLTVRQSAVAVKAWTGRPLAVLELADPERWVPVADRLHGRGVGGPPVRAFQLVPVDEQGRWPWDVHPGTPGTHAAPDLTGLPVLTLR